MPARSLGWTIKLWQDDAMGIKDFEPHVAAALPDIVALVPKEPAARLGRWKRKNSSRERATRTQTALDELGDVFAERLLGALELAVDRLVVDIPHDLVAGLTPSTRTRFGTVSMGGEQTATKEPLAIADLLHPGATDLVVDLVEALRDKAAVPDATGDEAQIAAQHGASHLALAVVVSTAVLRSLGTPVAAATPAIIGAALGAAVIVLPIVAKPPAYAAAVLDKKRAEYLLPRSQTESPVVTDHRFWFTEGSVPENVDFSGNGLVAAVEDGVVVRAGVAEGHVRASIQVLTGPPDEIDLKGWDEVVEVSWTAPAGGAFLHGSARKRGRQPRWEAPPWPGDYRVRVCVSGRDDDEEFYHLAMWQAPAASAIVHKKTDRLGHRLRGEPEPPLVIPPDAEHRWIEKGPLSVAATITVVRGLTPDEVITTFGGDPAAPVSMSSMTEQHSFGAPPPMVAVLAVDDIVLAVEDNGYQGANEDRLTALSRNGNAASLYWNVNANFQLTVAERGKLLFAGHPGHEPGAPHTEDLDFDDFRHRNAKGLTVLARVAGRGITAADIDAIISADQGYVLQERTTGTRATSRVTSRRAIVSRALRDRG
jgi:hypothetical protein